MVVALTARAEDFSVSNSLARLDQLTETVLTLERTVSRGSVRADCLARHLVKITSLTKLAHDLADSRAEHLAAGNTTAAEDDQVMIKTACTRVEKSVAEALECQGVGPSPNRQSPLSSVLEPAGKPDAPLPVIPLGDEATCLKQLKFAALLAQVMGLESATKSPMQVLAQSAIEPLNGWNAEACVTLDTFCVVIARALKLKVAAPAEPASYIQAVRDDGLPVEPLLRHRVLFESEVRLFLAQGYAAPLPSSRQLQPD